MEQKKTTNTQSQEIAINEHTKPMVVSASAGSGKTYTMIQRALQILLTKKANINQLLLVTFTEASATEMKQRLYSVLSESQDDEVKKQLQDFALADISTFDSFCKQLLQKYFYEIKLDPNFSVIDEMEADYLKNQALTQLYNDLQKNKDEDFSLLVNLLAKKRKFDSLSKMIIATASDANAELDKEEFYNKTALFCYDENLDNNFAFNYLVEQLDKMIECDLQLCEKYKLKAEQIDCGFLKNALEAIIAVLNSVLLQTKEEKIACFDLLNTTLKVPNKKLFKTEDALELHAVLLEHFRKSREKYQKIAGVFKNGDLEALKEDLKNAKNIALSYTNLVKKFEDYYARLKNKKCVLDFSDLEHKTYEILCNDNIANSIAKKYKFVFIDEFQDTNDLQFGIFEKISKYAVPFYVGDPKQSIYNFRNTRPEIINKLFADYKSDEKKQSVKFLNNFRSDREILEFVNYIFTPLMTQDNMNINYFEDGKFEFANEKEEKEYHYPKIMIGVVDKKKQKTEQEILRETYSVVNEYAKCKIQREMTSWIDLVANYINDFFEKHIQIYDKDLKLMRDVKFNDFAILLRNRSCFDKLAKKLVEYGFPVSVALKLNLFDCLEVQILHNFLSVTSNCLDDYALTNYLLSLGGMSEGELLDIRTSQTQQYFYDCCISYIDTHNNATSQKLERNFELLERYAIKLQVNTLSETLNEIMKELKLTEKWRLKIDGDNRVSQVELFIHILETKSFNSNIQNYLEFVKKFPDAFVADYSTIADEDCIKIMTIHNSKGLEFPITILGDCGARFNQTKFSEVMQNYKFGVALDLYDIDARMQDTLFIKHALKMFKVNEELREEMRLLYVALTRAKNYLGIFGDCEIEQLSDLGEMMSMDVNSYLEWIMTVIKDKVLCFTKEPQIFNDYCMFQIFDSDEIECEEIGTMNLINIEEQDKVLVEKLVALINNKYPYKDSCCVNLKNSVSKLLTQQTNVENPKFEQKEFLNKQTYNNHLLEANERGIAFHKAMELLNYFDNDFETQFEAVREQMDECHFLCLEKEQICNCFYIVKNMVGENDQIFKEKKFMLYLPSNEILKGMGEDKILVQGVIDLFIVKQDKIVLIDFKTNSTKNEDYLRTNYLLQLKLYSKAISNFYKKNVESYLYSFSLNKLIKID